MTAKNLKNPAASIRDRLLAHARAHGDDYQRVLTRYAIERLLARLGQTEATETYVLKGAMLFVTWPEHVFRPTGDLDLLGRGNSDPATVAELFGRLCKIQAPDDGIVFNPNSLRVEAVREADKYQGVSIRLEGILAGAIIPVQVDVGFGDYIYPHPERRIFPSLLPDLPGASILMYPPETVVAEKFEAMIRFGEANGRAKDFHDIWVISRTFPFELPNLVEAVGGTLRRRGTPIPTDMPFGLTDAFAAIVQTRGLWSGFLRRSPPTLQPPPFLDLLVELRHFFAPLIAGLGAPEAAHGQWNPNTGSWA